MTSVGKNMNFNLVRGRVTLLLSYVFSDYALLTVDGVNVFIAVNRNIIL